MVSAVTHIFKMAFGCGLTLLFILVYTIQAGERFVDNGDGTITDNTLLLMWQQSDDDIERSFADAETYAESLTLGGYNNWRLPTVDELKSLLDEVYIPRIDPKFDCQLAEYWSGTSLNNPTTSAYFVHFSNGYSDIDGKTYAKLIRCVRPTDKAPPKTAETVTVPTADIPDAPVYFQIKDKKLVFTTNFSKYTAAIDIYLLLINPRGVLYFITSQNKLSTALEPYAVAQTDAMIIDTVQVASALDGTYLAGWFLAPTNGGDVIMSLNDGEYELGAYAIDD